MNRYKFELFPSEHKDLYFLRVLELSGEWVMSAYDTMENLAEELQYWSKKLS